jgi:hypothetical protein
VSFRLRVWLLRLRLLVLYRWRRGALSVRVPLRAEPDQRGHYRPSVDTSGAYRPPFRSQFGDSAESHTSPHSEGSNCTMSSAAMALAYETGGRLDYLGGHMRHAQGDQEGGTDLYDAADAWASKGHSLTIRSGSGWAAVVSALQAGRGVILQGTGGLAGCGSYTGGHAIYVNPESSGSRWLKGDPECGAWEWCEARDLEAFAERLSSGVYWAQTAAAGSSAEVDDVALAVIVKRAELADVAAGVEFFEAPGGARIGSMSKAFAGLEVVGVPMDQSSDNLNLGWRAVWVTTGAVDGVQADKVVYIATADLTNFRPVPAPEPGPPPDGDEYARGRTDEYNAWYNALGLPEPPA